MFIFRHQTRSNGAIFSRGDSQRQDGARRENGTGRQHGHGTQKISHGSSVLRVPAPARGGNANAIAAGNEPCTERECSLGCGFLGRTLMEFPGRSFALLASTGPGLTAGSGLTGWSRLPGRSGLAGRYGGVPARGWLTSFCPIRGSQSNLQFVELIPLGVGPQPFRDSQKLLLATTRGNRFLFIHIGIISLSPQPQSELSLS